MISATVVPPSEPWELALTRSRALIGASRTESAHLLAHARKRASRYREKAKERGYRAGLERGHAESALQCERMIESLRDLYSTTIDTAYRDAYLMAYRIVEELIDQHLRESPEVIASWIKRAMEHLKQTSGMTLRYHPRYQNPLNHIATHLPSGITISMDESLAEIDFIIDTSVGTVSFSWRELLLSLKPTLHQERRV